MGDVEREITMLRSCTHDNIVRLYDTYEDADNIYLALEYCGGGDFGDKVKERALNLMEFEVADWMRQILSAVAVLHDKDICHRDIKPDNFMIADGVLKLSDFGLAVYLLPERNLTDKTGTPAFMAPEQHNLPQKSRGYGLPVDVWAAGVVMHMLLHCGRHPFHSEKGLNMDCLLKGQFSKNGNESNSFFGFIGAVKKERFSNAALNLCREMVNPSATSRITASSALQSPWFSKAGVKLAPQTPKIQPQNEQGTSPVQLLPPVVREGYSQVRMTQSNSDWMGLSLPKGEKDAPTSQVKEDLFGSRWRFPQRTRSAQTEKVTDKAGDIGACVFPRKVSSWRLSRP